MSCRRDQQRLLTQVDIRFEYLRVYAPLRLISCVLNELKCLTAFLWDTFPMTPWPPSSVPVPNRSGCHWLFSFVLQVSCGFERWSTKAVLWVPTVRERSWLLTGPAKNTSLAVSLQTYLLFYHDWISALNVVNCNTVVPRSCGLWGGGGGRRAGLDYPRIRATKCKPRGTVNTQPSSLTQCWNKTP